MEIKDFIPQSPGRISMSQLSSMLGCTDREIRKFISQARRSGEVIASDSGGYFVTDNATELARHYKSAYRRAISTFVSLKQERKLLKDAGIDVLKLEGRRK